jgi:formate dehydrogenase iron-sulfur subunit
MTRVFVPRDSGALAVGAEQVAQAIAREAQTRNIPIEIGAPARAASTGSSR